MFKVKKEKHVITDELNQETVDMLDHFIAYLHKINKYGREFNTFLYAFIQNRHPKNANDFNDKTIIIDAFLYSKDFYYDNGKQKRNLRLQEKTYLNYLYNFCIEYNYGDFEVINKQILSFHNVFNKLLNGYLFTYGPSKDEFNNYEKFIFIEDGKFNQFDFSTIKFNPFKRILKDFIFTNNQIQTSTKSMNMKYYVNFLNSMPNKIPIDLRGKSALDYKNDVQLNSKCTQSAFVEISSVRTFIKYLELNKNALINKTTEEILSSRKVRSKGKTDYYSKDDITKIIKYLDNKSLSQTDDNKKDYYRLMLIIILYILNTSMRLETILNLKIDDLKSDLPNTHFYITQSKRYINEKYNITENVKKLHDEVLNITNKYRKENCEISDVLFIHRKLKKQDVVVRFNTSTFNKILNDVCKKLSIKYLGFRGIRNRFMNKIMKNIDSGGDKNLLENITKHSRQVHFSNYYNNNLEQIVLQTKGVSIGSTPLTGLVKANVEDKMKSSLVMNGRGYCGNDNCDNYSNLDCLMCRHFICTPQNIPYFESEINDLDKKIKTMTIPHEKEFLIAKKALNVKYWVECKKYKKEHMN